MGLTIRRKACGIVGRSSEATIGCGPEESEDSKAHPQTGDGGRHRQFHRLYAWYTKDWDLTSEIGE